MKFCYPVDSAKLLRVAMTLVQSAQKEIIATMDMKEEIAHPLPQAYHRLLTKKAEKGIHVVRYGFGGKRAFNKLKKQYSGIDFIYGGSISNYKRMLIVDRRVGFFRVGKNVYKTKFRLLLYALVAYAKNRYNKENL